MERRTNWNREEVGLDSERAERSLWTEDSGTRMEETSRAKDTAQEGPKAR